MPNSYISKVRIGNTDFSFRDAEALAAAQAAQSAVSGLTVPVDGVTGDVTFKDANGNMYILTLDDKKVKLIRVEYNAPTITISGFKWNGSSTKSYNIDEPSTSSVNGAVKGTLTVSNGGTPTCNIEDVTITGEGPEYEIGGSVTIDNNSSKSFTFTTQGTTANPSTGTVESASTTEITVSRTSTVTSAWTMHSQDLQPANDKTGGFKFKFNGTSVTPTTQAFKDNTIVTLTTTSAGYIYIFTNSAKSFVMSTDLDTVGGKFPGGVITDLTDVQTYTTGKTYKVYRSYDSYPKNKTVYVKSIV